MDFHAHLDLFDDPRALIAQIKAEGVYVLSVTTTPKAFPGTKNLALGCERIRTALGLHPQLAAEREDELTIFDRLIGETNYVGEIGLDGSNEFRSTLAQQRRVFLHILQTCEESGGRILSIHSRGAAREIIDLLKTSVHFSTPILHWFTGTKNEFVEAARAGFWFSIGPAMLRSQRLMDKAALIPRSKVLLESDGPFAKYNGRSLSPLDTSAAIPILSQIWNTSEDEVILQLKRNLSEIGSIARNRSQRRFSNERPRSKLAAP